MPAVVSGTLHPGDPQLPSLDNDPGRAGRLLARHLLERGHRRLLLVNAMEMRPGDNAFFDGISEEITKADLPHNSLIVRCIPHDLRGFSATISELLARDARPTGVICQGLLSADLVTEAVAGLGPAAATCGYWVARWGKMTSFHRPSDPMHWAYVSVGWGFVASILLGVVLFVVCLIRGVTSVKMGKPKRE
jgi:hypothetical protein